MLNSGNQYLRPEYLSPLPTTLDAKKSPLALLAQTCSNIGADNPNNKPIIPALEKSKDGSNSNDSCRKDKSPVIISDDHVSKPSFKPYESLLKKEDVVSSESGGKKTPLSRRSSPLVVSRSPAASTGSCGKVSPAASDSGSSIAAKSESGSLSSLTASTCSSSTTTCTSQNTLSGLGYGSATSLGLDLSRSDPKDTLSAMSLGLNTYKAALKGLNPLANCTGCLPGHPVDAVSAAHTYASSIATQSGAMKASYPMGPTALSPYVGYARVKTASGGTSLVPVCRDPYCTNCQFSVHSAQLSGCPSGCTQCNHERLAPAALGLGHSTGLMSGLTGSAAAMAAAGAMPRFSYPHSFLPRPNVCSWMVGDTYCGKGFSTSEELLQHLRTHTSLSSSESPLSFVPPAYSLAPAGLGAACSWMVGDTYCGKGFSNSEELLQHLRTHTSLSSSESPLSFVPPAYSLASAGLGAACHLHYSTAASLTSPAGLRRTYPTSLSPVSSLSARYHPYKPQLAGLPGRPPYPTLTHPSLGMYYSPYGLFGQRLGPAVHP